MLEVRASDAAVMARISEENGSEPVGGWTERAAGARVTGVENVPCRVYEPDGAILSAGLVRAWNASAPCRVLIVALDWPGQLVLRCLVGCVREVSLELDWGTRLPARVEQVRFDPTLGRTCELHLSSVCQDSCVEDPVEDPDEVVRPRLR